ncbi:hypothetical protein T439DRAFT_377104 [Meredithblackwellia eburnea MCA 4105]
MEGIVLPSVSKQTKVTLHTNNDGDAFDRPATPPTRNDHRQRSGSNSSQLSNTIAFYSPSIKRSSSFDTTTTTTDQQQQQPQSDSQSHSQSQSQPEATQGRPTISYNTRPSSTQHSAHSANILPAASFFNPKRPISNTSLPTSSPPLSITSSPRFSNLPGKPAFLEPSPESAGVRRTPNGPLITRVHSEFGSPPINNNNYEPTFSNSQLYNSPDNRTFYNSSDDGDHQSISRPPSAQSYASNFASVHAPAPAHASAPLTGSRPSSPHQHVLHSSSSIFAQSSSPIISSSPLDNPSDHDHHLNNTQISNKTSREPLFTFPSSSPIDTSTNPATRSPIIPGGSPSSRTIRNSHSPSLSDDLVHQSRRSVEGAIQRAKLSFTSAATAGGDRDRSSPIVPGGSNSKSFHGGVKLLPEIPNVSSAFSEYELATTTRGPSSSIHNRSIAAAASNGAGDKSSSPHSTIPIPMNPVLSPKTGAKLRNYALHEGSNRFFLAGRLLTSGDNPTPFLLSLSLAVGLPVLFFVFNARFLWESQLGAGGKASVVVFAYLVAVMITSMCRTAWTDPGILPRGLDKVPERKWVDDRGDGQPGWKAEPRFLRVGEGVVASKWCETCGTYRPPRTSHCRLCDNCVYHTDHHCTFLNNCIGRRNYTSFIAFLISAILCSIYAIAFSAWHASNQWSSNLRWDTIGSIVVAVLAFALLCPIFGLFGYHCKLLWENRTTIEMLRPKLDRSGAINPVTGKPIDNMFSLSSPFANVVSLLCRPMDVPSWIEPHRYAEKDGRTSFSAAGNEIGNGNVGEK